MKTGLLVVPLFCLLLSSCGGDDAYEGTKNEEGTMSSGINPEGERSPGGDVNFDENPVIGDTCSYLSASEAAVACSENKLLFCSSVYNYEWSEVMNCSDTGSTCSASNDGLSGVCL